MIPLFDTRPPRTPWIIEAYKDAFKQKLRYLQSWKTLQDESSCFCLPDPCHCFGSFCLWPEIRYICKVALIKALLTSWILQRNASFPWWLELESVKWRPGPVISLTWGPCNASLSPGEDVLATPTTSQPKGIVSGLVANDLLFPILYVYVKCKWLLQQNKPHEKNENIKMHKSYAFWYFEQLLFHKFCS